MAGASRRSLAALTTFLVSVIVFGVILAFLSNRVDEEPEDVPELATDPVVDEILWVDTAVEPVVVPRELPISGRVVGADLDGLGGLRVICGGESVTTDDSGRFELEAAARRGVRQLSVRRDGEELGRWTVRVGDVPATPGDALAGESTRGPQQIRWSLTLLAGADGAGESANDAAGDGNGEGSQPTAIERLVRLRSVLVEEWGWSGVVSFGAASDLPDGAQLSAAILSTPIDPAEAEGDRLVASVEPVEVRGGLVQGRFRLPEDFRFYSDRYQFHVYFDPTFDYRQLELWKEERPDLPWEELGDSDLERDIFVGFVEEQRSDDRRIGAYYREALAGAVAMKELLEKQFFETRKLARGWDPALLARRRAGGAPSLQSGAVDDQGEFDQPAWRAFIDDAWRPRAEALLEAHRTRGDTKYPRANLRMDRLLKSLIELSRMLSIMIYQEFGLPPHRNDFYFSDYEAQGDAGLHLMMIRDDIKSLGIYTTLGAAEEPPSEKETRGRGLRIR